MADIYLPSIIGDKKHIGLAIVIDITLALSLSVHIIYTYSNFIALHCWIVCHVGVFIYSSLRYSMLDLCCTAVHNCALIWLQENCIPFKCVLLHYYVGMEKVFSLWLSECIVGVCKLFWTHTACTRTIWLYVNKSRFFWCFFYSIKVSLH